MNRILVAIFSLLAVEGVCQTYEDKSISRFFKLYPQEQAFLITDNSTYVQGESIWYKFYLWNAEDEQLSEDVRVLLRDEGGKIIEEQRVIVKAGEWQGDFQLAETQDAGIYRIDLITDWSLNFHNAPIATRIIRVAGKKDTQPRNVNGIAIVAEGGGLVAGKQNRIGFSTGEFISKPFTIELTSPSGERVLHKRVEDLYVVETVAINKPGEYTAALCMDGAECVSKKILTSSQSLQLVSQSDKRLRVVVEGSGSFYINVCSASRLLDQVQLQKGGEVEFNILNYPPGLYYVLLVDGIDNRIRSTLALYKKPESVPLNFTHRVTEAADLFISHNFAITPPNNSSAVHTMISANDAVSGKLMLNDLSDSLLTELLVFERFPLQNAFSGYLANKNLGIKRKLPTQLNAIDAPTRLLDIFLSEVHMESRIDSVVSAKKIIRRIKRDYNQSTLLKYAIPKADDSYVLADYTSINTATGFLDQAMPRLKKVNAASSSPYRFFYTNLKDQKQLYQEPPALIVNGMRLASFRAIEGFGFDKIKSMHAIYNSRTLLEGNLQALLPGGGIFLELEDAEKPQPQLTALQRFSGQFSWPHYYEPFTVSETEGHDRIPALNAVYHWTNYGLSEKQQRVFTIDLPIAQLQKTRLVAFSLQSVREGSYLKIPLDSKL